MASTDGIEYGRTNGDRRGADDGDTQAGQEHTSLGWILAISVAIGIALVTAILIVRLTHNDDTDLTLEGSDPVAAAATPAGVEYDLELTPGPDGVVLVGTARPDAASGSTSAPAAPEGAGTTG